jgi:hypothetical protein
MLSGPMFERSGTNFKRIVSSRDDTGAHYSIFEIKGGMAALRELFPDGKANDLNFVLFSTSGVHGSYTLLEELNFDESSEDHYPYITVLIIQPRLVCLRYGQFEVTPEDVEWLKGLRQSSLEVAAKIGIPE